MVIEEAAKLSRQLESRVRFYPQGCGFSRAKGWEVEVVFRGHRILLTFKEDERVNQAAKNAIEALMTESSDLRPSAVPLRTARLKISVSALVGLDEWSTY